jgi:hypothetical protein
MTEGTVIYQYIGRALPAPAHWPQSALSCADWQNWLTSLYEGFVDTSPLQIMAQKFIRSLQNDACRIFTGQKLLHTLTDGNTILFFPPDVTLQRHEER